MEAFGKPGIPPTWATSDKDRVGTALGTGRLWFTLGHGILNEVFWPSVGRPQTRDLGFLVARPGFWREVKRVARYRILEADPASPLVEVVHEGEGYRLHLAFVPDPRRDALLIGFRSRGRASASTPCSPRTSGEAGGATPPGWKRGPCWPRRGRRPWPSWAPSRGEAPGTWVSPMAGRTSPKTGP